MINGAVSYFDVKVDQKLMKGRLSHQKGAPSEGAEYK